MAAGAYDITDTVVGETFRFSFTWRDGNRDPMFLAGYRFVFQVRPAAGSTDLILQAVTDDVDPVLDAVTGDPNPVPGTITLGTDGEADQGRVSIYIPSSVTLAAPPGSYKYTIKALIGTDSVDDNDKEKLGGKFKLAASVISSTESN